MTPSPDLLADRLRIASTWRVLGLAGAAVAGPLVAIVVLVAVADATRGVSPLPAGLHRPVVGLPTVLVLYAAGRRLVLRAPAGWFLAGRPDRGLVLWVLLGLALPAAVLGGELLLLEATPVEAPPAPGTVARYVVASLAAGLLAAVLEELAFRGALLRLLEARWGPRVAIGATAAVFAALHQGHAGGPRTLGLVLVAMVAAGLLLGVVVVRTRSVWNAVALHAGWNTFFGGHVVAVAPAGSMPGPAVLRYQLAERSWLLTGGEATLGAAPLTTAALLAAALAAAHVGSATGPVRVAGTRPADPEGDR